MISCASATETPTRTLLTWAHIQADSTGSAPLCPASLNQGSSHGAHQSHVVQCSSCSHALRHSLRRRVVRALATEPQRRQYSPASASPHLRLRPKSGRTALLRNCSPLSVQGCRFQTKLNSSPRPVCASPITRIPPQSVFRESLHCPTQSIPKKAWSGQAPIFSESAQSSSTRECLECPTPD